MPNRAFRRFLFVAFLSLLAVSAGFAAEPLKYELRFEKPNTHLMDVTIHAGGLDGHAADFAIPAWAPGSYYIMDYAANVQGFRATTAEGKDLVWHKTDTSSWHIELNGANRVTVQYQIYGNTLANNLCQYNDQHAFIGGPSVWMYLVGGKERPIELSIDVPSGWKVATGMTPAGENSFSAADYNWFADAPLEISNFAEKTFEVSGTTFHLIVHDIDGGKDFTKFADDLKQIAEGAVPMFAPVTGTPQPAPFTSYYFLLHIWPHSGGGLEHLNSTQIDFSSDWDDMKPAGPYPTAYALKLFVTAHEFFHAWNVKRIRPRPLGPFDYSREVHTPSLWISEGLTSYYGDLLLVRAGLMTPEDYLARIGKLITSFEREPGRAERSIEDTSWDTWFNRLRTENNLSNTNYSYYDGGQVIGHLLDFAIRENTHNEKSLDDWMRLLYSRYALPKPGFEPNDAMHAASEVAGMDLSDFFHRYISGKEPLDYEKYFAYAGIAVEKKTDPSKAWWGTGLEKSDDGHAKITNVVPGSPADVGGLSRDDEIIAVNGKPMDNDAFTASIHDHKPGEAIRLTVIREGALREVNITLAPDPRPTYTFKLMEHPTAMQQQIYKGWLGLK